LLYYISSDGRKLNYITESIEDAYDLAEGFLWDKFNLSKKEIIKYFAESGSDYVDLYNPDKIDYWKDIHNKNKIDKYKYFFRIVIDYIVTITK